MPTIEIKDINNSAKGSLELPEEYFGIKGKEALLHGSVVNYLANQRQGTHATKTKGNVSGGGRKPYKQKGTGRARAGSNRSPLWKGGGTTFGPSPRDYSYRMPKQARRLALFAALSAKIADGEVVVLDALEVAEPKTKLMAQTLENLGLLGQSLLMVVAEVDGNVALSVRNIPAVQLIQARNLHAYHVLSKRRVLITKDAMAVLQEKVS